MTRAEGMSGMTTDTRCLHDLGITISAGDLEDAQLDAMREILEREVQALVERVNVETHLLVGNASVGWYVSYNGVAECRRDKPELSELEKRWLDGDR